MSSKLRMTERNVGNPSKESCSKGLMLGILRLRRIDRKQQNEQTTTRVGSPRNIATGPRKPRLEKSGVQAPGRTHIRCVKLVQLFSECQQCSSFPFLSRSILASFKKSENVRNTCFTAKIHVSWRINLNMKFCFQTWLF
jgi:hypothetical protein